jgi:hypothetical protein
LAIGDFVLVKAMLSSSSQVYHLPGNLPVDLRAKKDDRGRYVFRRDKLARRRVLPDLFLLLFRSALSGNIGLRDSGIIYPSWGPRPCISHAVVCQLSRWLSIGSHGGRSINRWRERAHT